jgi:hypothetical protein
MFLVPHLRPSRLAKGGTLKAEDLFQLPVEIIEASYGRSEVRLFVRPIEDRLR